MTPGKSGNFFLKKVIIEFIILAIYYSKFIIYLLVIYYWNSMIFQNYGKFPVYSETFTNVIDLRKSDVKGINLKFFVISPLTI